MVEAKWRQMQGSICTQCKLIVMPNLSSNAARKSCHFSGAARLASRDVFTCWRSSQYKTRGLGPQSICGDLSCHKQAHYPFPHTRRRPGRHKHCWSRTSAGSTQCGLQMACALFVAVQARELQALQSSKNARLLPRPPHRTQAQHAIAWISPPAAMPHQPIVVHMHSNDQNAVCLERSGQQLSPAAPSASAHLDWRTWLWQCFLSGLQKPVGSEYTWLLLQHWPRSVRPCNCGAYLPCKFREKKLHQTPKSFHNT